MSKIVNLPRTAPATKKGASFEFITTPTASEILSALSICQRKGWMGSVIGAPGIGKTTTFHHYASTRPIAWRERRRVRVSAYMLGVAPAIADDMQRDAPFQEYTPGVLMVALTGAMRSPTALMVELTRDLVTTKANVTYRFDVLSEKLREGDLIIIDEAQNLGDDALDILRSLHDKTSASIFIGGNPKVMAKPDSARERDMAQFYSRLAVTLRFDETSDEDLKAFFDHHQIVGARARALLRTHAGRSNLGTLRRISYYVEICHELAGEGQPIELGHVEKAVQALADR